MTLPGSGPLSMSAFATEYGVAVSTPLSGFLNKPGIGGATPIAFSRFYGQSNVAFTPDGGNVGAEGVGSATFGVHCNQVATWTYSLVSGTGGSVDIPSGNSSLDINFTVTAPGAGTRTCVWNLHGVALGVARDFTVTVDALGTG